jgi:hypothetical protein
VVTQPVHAHDLVSGVRAPHDGHASCADADTLGDKATKRRVGTIVDRWRSHAHKHHALALPDNLIGLRAERLARLPQPKRRLGRERDPHAVDRANLTSALQACHRELQTAVAQHSHLQRALGNGAEIRAERVALERAIDQTQRELAALANELVARETRAPGTRAREIFDEPPILRQLASNGKPISSWSAIACNTRSAIQATFSGRASTNKVREGLAASESQNETHHEPTCRLDSRTGYGRLLPHRG